MLRVSGPDARKFLQGLITNDMAKAQAGRAIHAGLLSPQGKILFDFFLAPDGDSLVIDVARDKAEELLQRLGFYRLRAAVTIEAEPSLKVAAAWGDADPTNLPAEARGFRDPRLAQIGLRLLLPRDAKLAAIGCDETGESGYHAHRIALGVPEGGRDYALGDAFPHEAMFDQLNGVDFDKGCYVGQEVVSRMQHRGTARTRVVPLLYPEGFVAEAGADVAAGDRIIGKTGTAARGRGLAMIRLDRAQDALGAGQPITAGGLPVELVKPDWVTFPFPGSSAKAAE